MSLNVGVIGLGAMGAYHANLINEQIAHASVVAVYDKDLTRAQKVVKKINSAQFLTDPFELISSPNIDAVVIVSPDDTHLGYALECIKANKHVLCEKPLATTAEECMSVIDAEQAQGKRLLQVGFMRRFDPSYNNIKKQYTIGKIGKALMLHCVHRNAKIHSVYGSPLTNSLVHEIDISRWLLNAEIISIQAIRIPSMEFKSLDDPLFTILKTDKGQIIDVDHYWNAKYGYDIRTELVCEHGTLTMAPPVTVETRESGGQSFPISPDFRSRFADAYRLEIQAWINSIRTGQMVGASAWDGYIATAVAETGEKSIKTGLPVNVSLKQIPAFYRSKET